MRGLSIGSASRKRFSKVLRETGETIMPQDVSKILSITRQDSALLLSYWNKQGWVRRIQRGLYIPIPLEADSRDISVEDPSWVAMRLFSPCYIGGWSAAEYWDMTEQLFITLIVMTVKRPNNRTPNIDGMRFKLKSISKDKLFGLEEVWRGKSKIRVSDPSRTIADMLMDPQLAGGIRPVRDVFQNYLMSENRDIKRLIRYCRRLKNGTVFKRLGLLLEMDAPEEKKSIKICKDNLSQGYSKLSPVLNCSKIITKWKLYVPKSWVEDFKE